MAMYLNSKYFTIILWILLLRANLINTDSSIQKQGTGSPDDFELCKRGETLRNHALKGGRNAGAYYKIGKVRTFNECIDLCCSSDCTLALYVKRNCYSVECESAQLCKPIRVHRAIKPSIFRRYRATVTHGRDASMPLPNLVGSNVTLKREKRFGSCQHYTGTICSTYLDPNRLVYYNEPPKAVEKRLSGPLTVIQVRFKSRCKKFALPALCLTSFPYCEAKPHPQPVRLCKDDCEGLYAGVCNHDFNLAKRVALKYPPLLKIIPDCANLTTPTKQGDDCVKLGLNEGDTATTNPSTIETIRGESDRTTPFTSTHYLTKENEARFSKPTLPLSKATNVNISSLQPTNANADDSNVDVKDASTTTPTLDNTDSDENIASYTPSSGPTHFIPSQSKTTHTQDKGDKTPFETETKKIVFETTNVPLHSTNELQAQTTHISPSISPTKVSPSTLLSSVFTKQKLAGLASGTEKINRSNGLSVADSSEQPTIINVNTTDETDFEMEDTGTKQKSHIMSTIKHTRKPTKVSIIHLQVSTVGDKIITLPKDTASLYASAWPKETDAHPYTYQWLQISSPEHSHGYMEGKNAQRVVLSQLKKPGVYQLAVIVRSSKYAYGKAYVNVTVEKPKRVNKPPRADISPKEQSITLPTNEVVLDGSKSSDDDKIVEYKWQELKGPLTEKNKIIKSGVDTPILQLKSLLPGVYTYKLTVKDADGETDSTTATVTVNAEKDYPPVARAGNDVVITLPENFVTLYGNGSTDDHGIKTYEWSKSPLSPACDLQGSTGPVLHVSNMIVGDYTFTLKVTDSGGQSSESKVTVVVRPEKNSPPIAKAGDDKDLVIPDDSTTLSALESSDDQGIVSYMWEKISGPSSVVMSGVDKMVLSLSLLTEGHYVFKLTVTDAKGLTGTDMVSVNVKRDGNKPPRAEAGPDVFVKLPNRAAALDGSSSTDDYGIVSYTWARDLKSPAAGDVINSSNHQPILRLSNLVKGVYKFRLTVKDAKGLESYDDAEIFVKEDENSPSLVELYLDVDITSFTEENKRQLVRKLAVSLDVSDNDIIIEHIQPSGRGNSLVVLFYVLDSVIKRSRDGKEIAYLLKQKVSDNFFEFRMQEVEPYVCRNNCSGHGFCDQHTKQCICESFWMQDPFKARFGLRESNCDWSILYVTVIIFAVIVAVVGISWGVCFCMGRTKSKRRKHQYSIIGDEDSDDAKNATMELFPRDKFMNSSIMSETDMDSDEETLFENHKPYKTGRTSQMNGMFNGAKKKNHHT